MGPPTRAHRGTDNRSEGRERPPARPSLDGRDLESNERAAQRHSTRHRAAVSKIICLRLHARTTTTVSANRHHRDLLLPDADRFHQQHVEPNGGQQVHGARRRGREAAQMPAAGHRPDEHPGIDAVLGHPHPDPPSGAPPLNRLDGSTASTATRRRCCRYREISAVPEWTCPTRVGPRSARLRGGDQRGGLCGGSAGG